MAAYFIETEALQGEPADGAVVPPFPSEQAVRDFVNDQDSLASVQSSSDPLN